FIHWQLRCGQFPSCHPERIAHREWSAQADRHAGEVGILSNRGMGWLLVPGQMAIDFFVILYGRRHAGILVNRHANGRVRVAEQELVRGPPNPSPSIQARAVSGIRPRFRWRWKWRVPPRGGPPRGPLPG